MADVAVKNSDKLILTSDNPRFEEPDTIINDMKKGVETAFCKKLLCITDRREAIRTAVALSKKMILYSWQGKVMRIIRK